MAAVSALRNGLAAGLLLLLAGCSMDPFIYTAPRTGAYVFDPEGSVPEEAVDPSRIERLWIPSGDGVTLGAVRVRAPSQAKGAVLYFHGAGSHLDGQFWRIKRFANLGYDVLAVDYRGFGASTPLAPSEEGLDIDTRAALTWMRANTPEELPLIYYGHSFGSAVAVQRAVADPPDVLILEAPFPGVARLKSDASQLDFPSSFIARDTWDTVGRMAFIDVPLLVAHGTADALMRVEFGREVYAAANEPKQLIIVEGGEHGTLLPQVEADYVAFLDAALGR